MKSPIVLSILFCILSGIQQVTSQSSIKSSVTYCTTKYDSSSVASVSTQSDSYSYTITKTVTITTTPVTRITPPPVTTTVTRRTKTVTTSTRPALTDTYTSTFTTTEIQTVTADPTTITESTITTTTIGTTSTSAYTGATVTPIFDTIFGAGPARRKRSHVDRRQSPDTSSNPAAIVSSGYPDSAKCSALYFKIVIYVEKKAALMTKTITARPSTSTSTVFSTHTSTSTVCPPNTFTTITTTSTITSFTTTTPAVTTTTTSTATETIVAAVETYYPQCGPNNSASRVNGAAVRGFTAQSDYTSSVVTGISQTACCVQCLLDASCAATNFGQGPGSASTCVLLQRTDGTCDPSNPLRFSIGVDPNFQGGARASYQNGKCGIFNSTYNV